jgi:hypothetical protein
MWEAEAIESSYCVPFSPSRAETLKLTTYCSLKPGGTFLARCWLVEGAVATDGGCVTLRAVSFSVEFWSARDEEALCCGCCYLRMGDLVRVFWYCL